MNVRKGWFTLLSGEIALFLDAAVVLAAGQGGVVEACLVVKPSQVCCAACEGDPVRLTVRLAVAALPGHLRPMTGKTADEDMEVGFTLGEMSEAA